MMNGLKKLNYKNRKFLIGSITSLIILAILYIFVWDNKKFWGSYIGLTDRDSEIYSLCLKRIIITSANDDISEYIIDRIESNSDLRIHNFYIQLLGFVGEERSSSFLLKKYADYQKEKNYKSSVNYIIDSLGMIGTEQGIPILERLLINYDAHEPLVTKYSIARALYLATGKQYSYDGNSGGKAAIPLTDKLEKARRIIINSRERQRSLEEILFFSKLYRP